MMPDSTIAKLRIWAYLEGGSLLALVFVCMPLKYVWDIPEGVKYVGAFHGAVFLFYSIWLLVGTLEYKWGWDKALMAFASAFIPAGTFYIDRKVFRNYLDKS